MSKPKSITPRKDGDLLVDEQEGSELDQNLLDELTEYFIAGVQARDKNGHSGRIVFRVREDQEDIVGGIFENCPKGWFNSKSALERSLFAIGCRVAFIILKKNKQIKELKKQMDKLNKIAKAERLEELEKEAIQLQQKVILRDNGTLENRSKTVFEIEKIVSGIKTNLSS